MKAILIGGLAVLVAGAARADRGVGVIATGDATVQPLVSKAIGDLLPAHARRVQPSPLSAEQTKHLAQCVASDDVTCEAQIIGGANAEAIVYVRATSTNHGDLRDVAIVMTWLARGRPPITQRDDCKQCTDDAIRITLDAMLETITAAAAAPPAATAAPPVTAPAAVTTAPTESRMDDQRAPSGLALGVAFASSLMVASMADRIVVSTTGTVPRAAVYLRNDPIDLAFIGTTMYVVTTRSAGNSGRIYKITGF